MAQKKRKASAIQTLTVENVETNKNKMYKATPAMIPLNNVTNLDVQQITIEPKKCACILKGAPHGSILETSTQYELLKPVPMDLVTLQN